MTNTLYIIECALGLLLMLVIFMQPSKSDALSGLVNSSQKDTFFGRNKNRTREFILEKCTWCVAFLFAVNTLIINIVGV